MKKRILCLLVALLLLAGCKQQEQAKEDIAVTDALCPYRITYREGGLQLEANGNQVRDVFWEITAVPEDVCSITRQPDQNGSCLYQIDAVMEGAAQLCLRAYSGENTDNVRFELTVDLSADGQKQITVLQSQHKQIQLTEVETEKLRYKWEVDMQGVLRFVLLEKETSWTLEADADKVCAVSAGKYLPSGFSFEAEPLQAGTATVTLREEEGRTLVISLQVDAAGNITLGSVQEQ